jgi:hypothetical protein
MLLVTPAETTVEEKAVHHVVGVVEAMAQI